MESSEEKTEQPTAYKLKEAKKKGNIAKSLETVHFAFLAVMIFIIPYLLQSMLSSSRSLYEILFYYIENNNSDIYEVIEISLDTVMPIFILVLSVPFLIAIIANVVQFGFIFSSHPLKPDINRLNPIKGLKKLFSIKTIFETVKTAIKLVLFSVVLYFIINYMFNNQHSVIQSSSKDFIDYSIDALPFLISMVLLVMLPVVIVDWIFSRQQYTKQMRMTKKELKDEMKKRDGDPLIKRKRKEIEKEMRKKTQSIQQVASADVVITNPTHYAVALGYSGNSYIAPKILSKGTDEFASKIREKARQHNIRIIENRSLARELYKKSIINGYIPLSTYFSVAKIYSQLNQ